MAVNSHLETKQKIKNTRCVQDGEIHFFPSLSFLLPANFELFSHTQVKIGKMFWEKYLAQPHPIYCPYSQVLQVPTSILYESLLGTTGY